jgi:hypothetical protein
VKPCAADAERILEVVKIRKGLNGQNETHQIRSIPQVQLLINGLLVCAVKALVHSGGIPRPGTGSLHPVAIRAAVEATRLLKPLVQRVAKATWRACRP